MAWDCMTCGKSNIDENSYCFYCSTPFSSVSVLKPTNNSLIESERGQLNVSSTERKKRKRYSLGGAAIGFFGGMLLIFGGCAHFNFDSDNLFLVPMCGVLFAILGLGVGFVMGTD